MFINVSRYTIAALRPADVFPLRAPRAPNFYSLLLLLARTPLALALSHLSPPSSPSLSQIMEVVYLAIFTFELMSKVLAYGFLFTGESAYLRDPWCQLDFVVVSLA